MSILIFEQCGGIARRLVELVNEAQTGMKVYHSDRFSDAIMLLQQNEMKIALLGLNFNFTHSVELLQAIKTINKNTLVIVLHSYRDEISLQQCRENGADFLFDKYNDFEKIPAIVKSVPENYVIEGR